MSEAGTPKAEGAPPEPGDAAASPADEAALSSTLRRAIVAAATIGAATSAASTALLPLLLSRFPALLLVLSSDGRNIALAAARLELATVLAIAVPRRVIAMLITYGVARVYGRVALRWTERRLPRIARAAAWLERVFARAPRVGLVVFPSYITASLAGLIGLRLRAFGAAVLVGQTAFVLSWFFLGDAISGFTDRALEAISGRIWEATAACAALVLLQQLVARRRRRASVDP